MQYEYDYDSGGERIVLGTGTYGTVYAGMGMARELLFFLACLHLK